MENKVLMWVTEVEVPFHHSFIKRWEVVIVDFLGNKLVEDWNFDSREEAQEKMSSWEDMHRDFRVFSPNIRTL